MKGTRHNGRSGKNGVYNPLHNDRRFNPEHSEHIDNERVRQNIYWDCYQGYTTMEDQGKENNFSFEQIELAFYEEHYGNYVMKQNERHVKARHPDRCKEVEDVSDPLPIKEDRVHFKNGTYFVNQKFINQKEWTQNRLTVNYNKDTPKPEKWLTFLDGLLEADDIVCLQEFMGYCLIPSNRGQKMLLIIGKGGEGKSRIGRILKRIFGHNMNSGSLQKLETDKFARADQEGKLLYLDDDMKTEALPSTNVIKAIVTAEDEMDLEKKNKQSYQGLLVCRILAFGNGTLKSLFDRSQGFYRRQIILETKDVPPDRINDPYLADKMMEEVEGIVLWCIEGLERLIRNDYQFTISNKSQLLMNEMQEDDDNILSFLESTGYIGLEKGTHATSKDLYVAYCRWCNDNLDVPVSERSFARRFKERSADYGMTYDKNISVGNGRFCRGFRGVHVKVRTKDVNY